MTSVSEWLASLPTEWMYAGFFTLGLVRGLGYYAVGAGGHKAATRRGRKFSGRAVVALQRHGARAVVVTYPFYGLAGATQLAAGATRVRLVHFALALALVSALWAALQTAVGAAAITVLTSLG